MISDERQGANWLTPGRTHAENNFSPLTQINSRNIQQLGLAWYLDLPRQGSLQATPLAVDGVLYFSGTNGKTFSVDARSGKLRWQVDPDLANHPPNPRTVLFGANRGVAFWKGKVYVGFVDGRLSALDAKTGSVIWTVQTFDEATAERIITGAPRVFKDKVIIGNGGYGKTRGFVTAYNVDTGKKIWRFYTVPGNPSNGFESQAMLTAAKSWRGQWWTSGGHGSVWDSIVYDPDLDRIYIGTGNAERADGAIDAATGGDNLYASSIVALDADTGGYVWHYQINPGDIWNYDATQQIVLANVFLNGMPRKVLMQAPKNGFFYVIDRTNGKLLSAEKIGRVTWAQSIDVNTGRPIEASTARDRSSPLTVWPSALGVHNWQRMSFNPRNGLVYIPIMQLGMANSDFEPKEPGDGIGALLAWDPVAQKRRWEVQYHISFWNGGALATGGNLVFHGTGRGQFIAYDAATGRTLWNFDAGLGINAAPMTYEVDGVQQISLLVGYGGTANISKICDYGWRFNEQPRRLLTFSLGKNATLPPSSPPRFDVRAVDDKAILIDGKQAAKGAEVYRSNCTSCHGSKVENYASIAPDLRESALAMNWEAFKSVVLGGAFLAVGMPRFDNLDDEDAHALYMYIRQRARDALNSPPSN